MRDIDLWREYDEYCEAHPQEEPTRLFPGLERMNAAKFKREYEIFKQQHLLNRIIVSDGKLQLPDNSIYHECSNFYLGNHTPETPFDIFTPEVNEFISNESYRKFVYNIREPDLSGPLTNSDKFIYRINGLPQKLLKFRQEHSNEFKFINSLDAIPTTPNTLSIINHNPLFRLQVIGGNLRFLRKINIILTSIINTAIKLAPLGKHQFIDIWWGEETYSKEVFNRVHKEFTVSTVKYPDNYQYIIMMHFLNFIYSEDAISIFNQIPKEYLDNIDLVFSSENTYLFYNLGSLSQLNTGDITYRRVINQLNLLAVSRMSEIDLTPEVKKELDKYTSTLDDTDESNIAEKFLEIGKNLRNKEQQAQEQEEKEAAEQDKIEKLINKVQTFVQPHASVVHGATRTPNVDTSKPVTPVNNNVNASTYSPDKLNLSAVDLTKNLKVDNYTKDFMEENDRLTEEFIDNYENITPAQRNRAKRLAKNYKQLKLHGKTLEQLLTKETDNSISNDSVSEEVLGLELIDKGAATSTLSSFDKDYMSKTYFKHMAGVFTSFQKNGAFLQDIKEEKYVDDLNNYTVYTLKFEDIDGKRSTLKFKIPTIDREGYIKVDGIKKIIKKQRVNLPIVKISETEVSLASNYNKTLVERNLAKAHSYISYIEAMLKPEKSRAVVTYGTHYSTNVCIAYEYSVLAEKYKTIVFNQEQDRWEFFFDYNHRLEHFGGEKVKLDKLEEQYGTYCGKTRNNYLFVDRWNELHITKFDGQELLNDENSIHTIKDALKLSLREGVSFNKQLTEWCTIRLLDAKLPIIFLLAYRYGLHNILDYLKIDYTITEARNKIIVGGSQIAQATEGTESAKESKTYLIPSGDVELAKDYIDRPIPLELTKEMIEPIWKRVIDLYAEQDIDLSYMKCEFSDKPRFTDGKIDNAMPVEQFGACLCHNQTVYINPKFIDAVKYYEETDDVSTKFYWETLFSVVTHELAHEVDRSNLIDRDKLLNEAKEKNFTTSYLDAIDTKQTERYNSELFAEYLRTKVLHITLEQISTGSRKQLKYSPKPNDISIRFADRVLWFNRYPLEKSLVLAGLDDFDLTKYSMADFESNDVYFQLLQDRGKSINYIKGIDSFFDLFVDNMTYNILRTMNEPTNVRDLLIRSAELLSTLDHKLTSAKANHRLRGYEQFNTVLYNELARQFSSYQANRNGKGVTFSINPEAIYLRLISNASMVPSEAANPIQYVKEQSYMTYAGVGGRTAESFVVDDRTYSLDDVGVISEATVDNFKVGMMGQLSWNPMIENTEGILGDMPADQVPNSRGWCATTVTFPFGNRDDANRINFISVQSTHMVPTETVGKQRVRTGYERVFAHRCGKQFAGIAEKDGKITSIDEKLKLIQVTYSDGTEDYFKYGEDYSEIQGFYASEDVRCNVRAGQKIKKGDIITYNAGFFNLDPMSNQLDLSIGVQANVAFIELDVNYEDATEISQRLADKLNIFPVQEQVISLNKDSLIHKCVEVGDHVKIGDPLMIFEEDISEDGNNADSFELDEDTTQLLVNLNKKIPKAKFSGEVVKVDVHYGCPISEMHPSLATIVRNITAPINKASKLASDSLAADEFPPSTVMPSTVKFKGVQFDEETVVFTIYIKEHETTTVGDKIVVCNQLKNTISSVMSHKTLTEDDQEVDVLFSSTSAARRIVLSPILMGLSGRIMHKIEDDILEMYFGK